MSGSGEKKINWSEKGHSQFTVEDGDLKNQLIRTEKLAFQLHEAEENRKLNQKSMQQFLLLNSQSYTIANAQQGMNASSPLFQNSISTFLENEKKKLQAQLEQLNKEKQENNQQAKINEQEKQQKIKQQKIRALESEKDCLQEQIDENKKLIEKIQATISKHSQDTSQRSKDDLESLEENIKRKESSLQSHKDIYKKFNEFFEHSVVPNYNRLTDLQKRAFETIHKSASMLPILIIKYLDGFLQFTSDLRKKLKRVKSDAKRIFKSYGEDAVSPIQSEYKKLKEIFVDCFKEFQDCKAIYSPIVLSLNRWLEFCTAKQYNPKDGSVITFELIDNYLLSANENLPYQRSVLLSTLNAFGYPPFVDDIIPANPASLQDIISKESHAQEQINAIMKSDQSLLSDNYRRYPKAECFNPTPVEKSRMTKRKSKEKKSREKRNIKHINIRREKHPIVPILRKLYDDESTNEKLHIDKIKEALKHLNNSMMDFIENEDNYDIISDYIDFLHKTPTQGSSYAVHSDVENSSVGKVVEKVTNTELIIEEIQPDTRDKSRKKKSKSKLFPLGKTFRKLKIPVGKKYGELWNFVQKNNPKVIHQQHRSIQIAKTKEILLDIDAVLECCRAQAYTVLSSTDDITEEETIDPIFLWSLAENLIFNLFHSLAIKIIFLHSGKLYWEKKRAYNVLVARNYLFRSFTQMNFPNKFTNVEVVEVAQQPLFELIRGTECDCIFSSPQRILPSLILVNTALTCKKLVYTVSDAKRGMSSITTTEILLKTGADNEFEMKSDRFQKVVCIASANRESASRELLRILQCHFSEHFSDFVSLKAILPVVLFACIRYHQDLQKDFFDNITESGLKISKILSISETLTFVVFVCATFVDLQNNGLHSLLTQSKTISKRYNTFLVQHLEYAACLSMEHNGSSVYTNWKLLISFFDFDPDTLLLETKHCPLWYISQQAIEVAYSFVRQASNESHLAQVNEILSKIDAGRQKQGTTILRAPPLIEHHTIYLGRNDSRIPSSFRNFIAASTTSDTSKYKVDNANAVNAIENTHWHSQTRIQPMEVDDIEVILQQAESASNTSILKLEMSSIFKRLNVPEFSKEYLWINQFFILWQEANVNQIKVLCRSHPVRSNMEKFIEFIAVLLESSCNVKLQSFYHEIVQFILFQFWPACLSSRGNAIEHYTKVLDFWSKLTLTDEDDRNKTDVFSKIITQWLDKIQHRGEIHFGDYVSFLSTIFMSVKESQLINWETLRIFELTKESTKKQQEKAEKIMQKMNFSKKFTPDPWQSELLQAYNDRASALVCAPTSSGKTFLAIEIIRDILSRQTAGNDGVVLYISPLKALASMVYSEMKDKFQFYDADGNLTREKGVGLLTGDSRIDPNASVIITVPEFCEILLLSSVNIKWCSKLAAVFFDEIHFIGAQGRGASVEHIFSFINCPFYAFSATLPDESSKFCQWLKRFSPDIRFINSTQRSTDLAWYVSDRIEPLHPLSLVPLDDIKHWIEEVPELIPHFMPRTIECILQTAGFVDVLFSFWLKENPVDLTNVPLDTELEKVVSLIALIITTKRQEESTTFPITRMDVRHFDQEFRRLLQKIIHCSEHSLMITKFFELIKAPTKESWHRIRDLILTDHKDEEFFHRLFSVYKSLEASNMLPAIVFFMSIAFSTKIGGKFIEALVKGLKLKKHGEKYERAQCFDIMVDLLAREDVHPQLKQAVRILDDQGVRTKMKKSLDETSINELLVGLLLGIGLHNAKLPSQYKRVVEYLLSKGLLKFILATATLATGINTPCKTIIIGNDSTFLSEILLHQMIGRAGRRGIEDLGHVIFFCLDEGRVRSMLSSKLPEISGCMPLTVSFILRLLHLINPTVTEEFKLLGYPLSATCPTVESVKKLLNTPLFIQQTAENKSQLENDNFMLELKHFVHFSLLFLHSFRYVNNQFNPANFASVISRTHYTEPANFFFVYLLQENHLSQNSVAAEDKERDLTQLITYFVLAFSTTSCLPFVKSSECVVIGPSTSTAREHHEKWHTELDRIRKKYNKEIREVLIGFLSQMAKPISAVDHLLEAIFPVSLSEISGGNEKLTEPLANSWASPVASMLLSTDELNKLNEQDNWIFNQNFQGFLESFPFAGKMSVALPSYQCILDIIKYPWISYEDFNNLYGLERVLTSGFIDTFFDIFSKVSVALCQHAKKKEESSKKSGNYLRNMNKKMQWILTLYYQWKARAKSANPQQFLLGETSQYFLKKEDLLAIFKNNDQGNNDDEHEDGKIVLGFEIRNSYSVLDRNVNLLQPGSIQELLELKEELMDDTYDPFNDKYIFSSDLSSLKLLSLATDEHHCDKPTIYGVDLVSCLFNVYNFSPFGLCSSQTIRLGNDNLYRYWTFTNKTNNSANTLFFFPDTIEQLKTVADSSKKFILRDVKNGSKKFQKLENLLTSTEAQLRLIPGLLSIEAFPACLYGLTALPFALSLAQAGWNVVLLSPIDPVGDPLPEILQHISATNMFDPSRKFYISVNNWIERFQNDFVGGIIWAFDQHRTVNLNNNQHLIPFSGGFSTKSYEKLFDSSIVFLHLIAVSMYRTQN